MAIPGLRSVLSTFFGDDTTEMIRAVNSLHLEMMPAMHCAIYGQVTQVISQKRARYEVFFVECEGLSCMVRCPTQLANGIGEGAIVEILATAYRNPQGIAYEATHVKRLTSYDDERGPLLRLIKLFRRFGELVGGGELDSNQPKS